MAKAPAKSRKRPNFVVRYFRETTSELSKVNWPTREEAVRLTVTVLVVLGVTSAGLGLLDFLFSRLFALVYTIG